MLSRLGVTACKSYTPLKLCTAGLRSAGRIATRPKTASGYGVGKQEIVKDWHYYGKLLLGGSALIGGGYICTVGMTKDAVSDVEVGALARSMLWPEYIVNRVRSTYLFFGGGLAATAATMVATQNMHALQNVMARHPFIALIGLMAATYGLSSVQRSIPYTSENMIPKLVLAGALYGVIGTVLGPMMGLGGPVLTRAAMYTGALVSGLTLAAVTAPSERYLQMSGPCMMGLCLVAAASIGSAFLPPTGLLGGGLYTIAVYGGVVVFSGILLYDTQRILKQCEVTPYSYNYDPISNSISIYMTTINLFIRIAQIVSGQKRK